MNYIISFLYENHFHQLVLNEKNEITIGSSSKDTIYEQKYKSSQIKIKNKKYGLTAESKKPLDFKLKNETREGVYRIDDKSAFLFVSPQKDDFSKKIELPHNGAITVGRSEISNIIIKNRYVSAVHCIISRQNGIYYVEDKNSSNGTYVNSIKVSKTKIESGDKIHIFTYTIELEKGKLSIKNAGFEVEVKDLPSGESNEKGTEYKRGTVPVYRRSPRTQEELPSEDIVLANPPSKGQRYEKSHGIFSSVASSAAMLGGSMAMGSISPAMLAARSAMLVMPATSIASQSSRDKKGKKRSNDYIRLREARFGNYLNEQRARIYSVAQQQKKIITDENPSPEMCYSIANNLNRNLWERTPADRDYLDVRLGMGYEELCVKVKDRGEAFGIELEDDDAKEMSAMLVEESKYVDNIPVRVSLIQNPTVGVIGDRKKVIMQVKNMIAELTTFHCYTDVKIVGIFDSEEYSQWSDLRWLPHIWDDNKENRYLAFDSESAHAICESFDDMLKTRFRETKENSIKRADVPNPYYIFILGSKKYMENEEIMSNLLTNNPAMGVSSLFLFDDIYSLPNTCNYIIDMQQNPVAYWRDKVNGKFMFTQDDYNAVAFDTFARRLSAIELKGFAIQAEIPSSITFLEGYGVDRVEELNVMSRWESNKPFETLEAPIGVLPGGKTFSLNIRENKSSVNEHGPHGLVAGTTGSGKSELLQSWILSMCVNFHPHDVNFVIIDYKGGGMANLLEDMPHVVGKITNIGTNIKRSIVSLERENKRRMAIFEQAGVNNIDKYSKLYHEGKVMEPLPHLVIVADEFAELKKEQPDFMTGLISIARVGRTLGIHLVLATQKPTGVVDDQIDSNSRFRLCLKVQDATDSREMLKTPDAASITKAGRAYVKIGNFEYYEQFQSYWSGAQYFEDNIQKADVGNQVRIVDVSGKRIKTVDDGVKKKKSNIDELKAVNLYICRVAEENGIKALPGPWLPELPDELHLRDLDGVLGGFDGEQWNDNNLKWLQIPVGKYDLPELQQQGTLFLDFQKDGHYGIYGTSGTGKTNLLKTIMTAVGTYYSPEDVNVFIIDCGGWSMSAYADLPHVGDVILDTEEEKINKFQNLINDEFNDRKRLFHDNIVSSLVNYRQSVGKMPAIIVMIDNIIPLFDLYPDFEETLIKISREGATYGIYLIYTAASTSGIRFKVLQNIKGAVAFELTDKGDYPSIVGRMEGKILPTIAGRAFYKDSSPLEFQCAYCTDGLSDMERNTNIKEFCNRLNRCWHGPRPRTVPVMPNSINVEALKQNYIEKNVVPVGVDYNSISTAYLNMENTYCAMITGSIGSGKSAFLCRVIETMKIRDDNIFYLFDSSARGLSVYSDNCKGYVVSNCNQDVSNVISEIVSMLNKRQSDLNTIDESEVASYSDELEQICIFIDDINEFVESVENEQRDMMNNIARLAKSLGVVLFAAGRISDVVKLADLEPLTNTIIKYQNGIAIGGSPAMYSFFNNNMGYSEKNTDCESGNGWLFYNGNCSKVMLN